MFAHIYPQPINNKWVWLCEKCWETPNKACSRLIEGGRKSAIKRVRKTKVIRPAKSG